ncbi:hypothetical protein BGZ60DRAFT_406123 [Tricladium varicosporioides]|nr:hypothetical protein BGZ60DRAFT_406123 [Hymenoscyphus varicosporioides]
MAGFVNRENRVPHYQKLFQEGGKQHIRQWNMARGRYMMLPYYMVLAGTFSGAMYMMVRQVLGHKTWWGK